MTWTSPVSKGVATKTTVSPIVTTAAGVVGRTYILCISRSTAQDPFTTVTDTGGNSWTRRTYAPTSGTAGRRVEMWTCVPTSTFTSVSAAFTGSGTAYATLVELVGANAMNAVASDFRTSAQGTAPPPVTITPSVADTMAVSMCQANSNLVSQMTASAGWTALSTDPEGPAVVYRNVASSGTVTGVSWTLTTAVGSGHAIIAYSPSAPPSPTISVWNGTAEVTATIEGVWNGTTVTAVTAPVEIA